MKKALIMLATALFLTACGQDYIPRTVFEIQTSDGGIIKLACPMIDPGRSEITYLIDGDCVVYR